MAWEDVRPGDIIPQLAAFWTGLKTQARRSRLLPGVGTRLRETPDGTIINFYAPPVQWVHPFRVSLTGESALLSRGLVDGIEPTINGIAMSGDDKNPQPTLALSQKIFTTSGLGLIALEVVCDKAWNTQSASIVQVARLNDVDPKTPGIDGGPLLPPNLPGRKTRLPLAQLRNVDGVIAAFQIEMFNQQHIALFPGSTQADARVRHFFFPG